MEKDTTGLEGIDLRAYWQILVQRRWLVYLTVISFGTVALVASLVTTPQYRATATLQIDRQNPDILDFQEMARTDYAWAAYNDFYQTQYRILESAPVARLAAERLGLADHPDFAGQARNPGWFARLERLIPRKRGAGVERSLIDRATARVLAGLEVSPIRNSHLVRVSWIHEDPHLAAEVANAITDAYAQFNIQSRYSTTDQAREFLVNQIGNLKTEIGAIENRLQEYGEAKRIFSVDDSSNLTLRALQEISEQRTAAQTALARAEAAYRAAREAPPEALPEVLESTLIDRLRVEYAAYEAEHSEKKKLFKEHWPGLLTLQSKLDQARERLDLETNRIVEQVRATTAASYARAQEEVRNLEALLGQQEQFAQRLKRDAVEYNNLQTEVRKKRETMDALLRRQNEMALSTRLKDLDTTSSNIRIVERAGTPPFPFRPSSKLNLLLGLLLGLVTGVALAVVLDSVDNTIGSPGQLGAVLSWPVLATVPRHGPLTVSLARVRRRPPGLAAAGTIDLIAHRDGHTRVSETYRSLRTSILLSNPGRPPRQIVVTSALPEEGKTATALNLAVVLAQLGRRVVLVDTDLRRPRLHQAFQIENRAGVSTLLSGLEQDLSRLIVPTGVDRLDVIASGPIPPNPSELLNSKTFAQMGADLLERGYDHVIYDTPPVLSVSDPVIVATIADTGILVVRAGRTPKQSVRLAAERLGQSGGGPFGVVLNGFDAAGPGAYYQPLQYYGGGEAATEPAPEARTGRATGGRP